MKIADVCALTPPTVNAREEVRLVLLGDLLAALCGAGVFAVHFGLFKVVSEEKLTGLVFHFGPVMCRTLVGFAVAGLCMLLLALWHYRSYRQGSMSIYLMRRLPEGGLLHRQCWTLPLLGLALYGLTALCLTGICYLIYRLGMPTDRLPAVLGGNL